MKALSKILKQFREDRRDLMAGAKKDAIKMNGWRWHFVGRGIELIAIDETGERNDDLGGPEFLETKNLSAKLLRETVAHWHKYANEGDQHKLAKIGLCYGLDVYDSFADYMENMREAGYNDYEIWGDWAEAEVPIELLEAA